MFVSFVNQVEFWFSKSNVTVESDKFSDVPATLDTTLPWSTCKLHCMSIKQYIVPKINKTIVSKTSRRVAHIVITFYVLFLRDLLCLRRTKLCWKLRIGLQYPWHAKRAEGWSWKHPLSIKALSCSLTKVNKNAMLETFGKDAHTVIILFFHFI